MNNDILIRITNPMYFSFIHTPTRQYCILYGRISPVTAIYLHYIPPPNGYIVDLNLPKFYLCFKPVHFGLK